MSEVHSPVLAAAVSFVPGLGHMYLGRKWKAAALFIFDLGMVIALFAAKTWQAGLTLFAIFFVLIMLPAIIDAYQLAKWEKGHLNESRAYVTVLLLTKGFWALPLLWQSHVFPKKHKVAWTVAVPVLAVLYFSFLFIHRELILMHAEKWIDLRALRAILKK